MNKIILALAVTAVLTPVPLKAGVETALPEPAGWYSRVPQGALNTHMYFTVDALDVNNLYIGGMNMPADNPLKMTGLALLSQDGGQRITNISGVTGSSILSLSPISDIESFETQDSEGRKTRRTWAVCGDFLALAKQAGTFDAKFTVPLSADDEESLTVMALHDSVSGAVGSTHGAIYLFELSDDEKDVTFTTATVPYMKNPDHPDAVPSINAMYWTDRTNGWAVATESEVVEIEEYDRPPVDMYYYYRTHVLRTTDGGRNWTLLSTITLNENEDDVHTVTMMGRTGPLYFEGGWIGQSIFMIDRDEGFLVLSAYDNTDQQGKVVKLLRTIDGSKTWSDCRINMQVGTIPALFGGDMPIFISEAATMRFWRGQDDVVRGRVAGSAFITKGSSSSGTPPKYFAVAMFGTDDGGATWDKSPELGTVEYNMTDQSAPACSTGRLIDADFIDPYRGFGVGEKGTVFRFLHKCVKQSECEFGYYCSVETATKYQCVPCSDIDLTAHAGSIEKCAGWEPPPEPDPELGGRDVFEPDTAGQDIPGIIDIGQGGDSNDGNDPSGGGCSGSRSGNLPAATVLFLMLAFVCRLRSSRETT